MTEEIKSRVTQSEERCLYSGDSRGDDVVYKRRKIECQGEEAETRDSGVKLFDKGEEELKCFEEEEEEESDWVGNGEVGEEKEVEVGEGEEVEVAEEVGEGEEVEVDEEVGEGEEVEVAREVGEEEEGVAEVEEMRIDRLSALPDSLLLHILSFLNKPYFYMREVVKTCVLSTTWKYLWTNFPKLEFSCSRSRLEEKLNFVASIHRTLVTRGRNHLKKFKVDFYYDEYFASDVNAWIEFAVISKVENVALLLLGFGIMWTLPQYMLPQVLYLNSSLTHLSLQGCIISPQRAIEWENLTKLYLEDVELHEHVIENIISGCPVLYELHLKQCWGLYRLEVDSRNLHALIIERWYNWEDDDSLLEILAPYVSSLRILLDLGGRKLRVTDVSALIRVRIEYEADYYDESLMVIDYIDEIFENLQHVMELEMSSWIIEVVSMLAVMGWRPPQSERKYLEIETKCHEFCIPGIVCLLESSPNLETFIINSHPTWSSVSEEYFHNGLTVSYIQKADLNIDLLHLKSVTIIGFAGTYFAGEPMLTVVRFLLKRATVLEKLIIQFRDYERFPAKFPSSGYYTKVAETLLTYPRSSPKAVIQLSN